MFAIDILLFDTVGLVSLMRGRDGRDGLPGKSLLMGTLITCIAGSHLFRSCLALLPMHSIRSEIGGLILLHKFL